MQALNSVVGGKLVLKPAARPAASRAGVVVCRASAEGARNAALSLCVTAAVAFSVALPAFAEELTTLPALVDNKKDNARVQLIYEARDLDIDAKPRSGQATRFAFEKLTVDQTKARAGESLARIDSVKSYADKKYWTQAKNELRRQMGTLRFDLDNLVAAKGAGATDVDALIKSLEKLDYAFRLKDVTKVQDAFAAVASNTSSVKAAVF